MSESVRSSSLSTQLLIAAEWFQMPHSGPGAGPGVHPGVGPEGGSRVDTGAGPGVGPEDGSRDESMVQPGPGPGAGPGMGPGGLGPGVGPGVGLLTLSCHHPPPLRYGLFALSVTFRVVFRGVANYEEWGFCFDRTERLWLRHVEIRASLLSREEPQFAVFPCSGGSWDLCIPSKF